MQKLLQKGRGIPAVSLHTSFTIKKISNILYLLKSLISYWKKSLISLLIDVGQSCGWIPI